MTYEECFAAGMTKAKTARALGVTPGAVWQWAKRNGKVFPNGQNDEHQRAGARERMKALHADPEFAAAHRKRGRERMTARNTDSVRNPLVNLSAQERAEYDIFRRKGRLSRAEALRAIGRGDLCGGAP